MKRMRSAFNIRPAADDRADREERIKSLSVIPDFDIEAYEPEDNGNRRDYEKRPKQAAKDRG